MSPLEVRIVQRYDLVEVESDLALRDCNVLPLTEFVFRAGSTDSTGVKVNSFVLFDAARALCKIATVSL